jgi:hypothetical protein
VDSALRAAFSADVAVLRASVTASMAARKACECLAARVVALCTGT